LAFCEGNASGANEPLRRISKKTDFLVQRELDSFPADFVAGVLNVAAEEKTCDAAGSSGVAAPAVQTEERSIANGIVGLNCAPAIQHS
jgi:hypothetical protein